MKGIILILFLWVNIVYSQGEHFTEIIMRTENMDEETVEFTLFEYEGTVFCRTTSTPYVWSECTNCNEEPVEITGNQTSNQKGWEICWDDIELESVAGFGLYKFVNDETSAHFYIDLRCTNYTLQGDTDFLIKYNFTGDCYRWAEQDEKSWYDIEDGEFLQIWVMKNLTPNTSPFMDYWSSALGLNKENNHPKLVWGPYSGGGASEYIIHRGITTGSPPSSYSPIDTVDNDVYSYVDEDLEIGGSTNVAYYKVEADLPSENNQYTNVVNTNVYLTKRSNGQKKYALTIYQLDNNYPNPFNPTTIISYGVPVKTNVSLKVFNSLGKEIIILVNNEKPAGSYEVKFDASILSSGIYFYRLQAGDFVQTRKMILLK